MRERKRLLRKTVDGTGFVRHATTTTVGEAKRAGAEGIVYKDPESPYVLGRSKAWRKYKFRNEADVAILGYEPGKGKRKGVIGALRIGVYDARGKRYRPVGKVGTGFTEEMLRELTPKVKAAQRPLVARVRYLKVGSQGALREPSFIALRQDIRPEATHL